jgi:hypothetical protein
MTGGSAPRADGGMREQMGGFDIIEHASPDKAIEAIATYPITWFGPIGVRAFWTA